MATKSSGRTAGDGSEYVTLVDGQGNTIEGDTQTGISGSLTATGNLFSVDMLNYESITVQVTSAGTTCTITYETSDDNTNWVSTSGLISTAVGATAGIISSTTTGLWQFARRGRYFRARVSTYTSGTVTAVGTLSNTPVNNIEALPTNMALATSTASIGFIAGGIGDTTSNGLTQSKLISAATTNATSLKASAGKLVSGYVYNTTASAKFLKIYNKASAPTVGTDTPIWTIAIPANGGVPLDSAFGIFGLYLSAGIAFAITGASADADTTAVAAGDVIFNYGYI